MEWFTKYQAAKILDVENGPKLFLGNVYDAALLAQGVNPHGINAVLDVSTEDLYARDPAILYLKVPFPDGHEIRADQFAMCMAFLKDCWERKMTIFIHCAAGISRSTSIVVSFIQYMGLGYSYFNPSLGDMDKILGYVALCRPIVNPAKLTFNSCKKWLRQYPYDGSFGHQAERKGHMESIITANILRLHPAPDCEVRKSIIEDDNRERHLLVCTCG